MGAEDAALGGDGKKLAMASIGFADVRVGAVYKDGRLVVGLPVRSADAAVPEVGVRSPDVAAAVRGFLRKREVAEFVSGAMAGAMTKAVLAPLETIRTRMVVGVGSKQIFGSFVEIIEQNGWQGLWAGNAINMLRIIPTQAIELGTFESVKRSMTSAQEKWKEDGCPKIRLGDLEIELPLHLLSPVAIGGAAAGIAGTLACHPLEVLKDRLTINREVYPSISIALNKIYRADGIGGLYAGLFPTLVGMLPYSTCYYFMYETIKTSYCHANKKKSLNRPELLVIGAISGVVLYPKMAICPERQLDSKGPCSNQSFDLFNTAHVPRSPRASSRPSSASRTAWPQRLFKLPDMLDAGIRERDRLDALFASEPSSSSATLRAIRERAREMERTLARAAAGVFFEFGLRVETHHVTGADATGEHVPKIVRYAVNYLKCLASDE